MHDAEKWLLTRRERDNPATGLDRGDMAWTRAWGSPVGRAIIDPDGRPAGR